MALIKNNIYGGLSNKVYKEGLMFYIPVFQ